MNVQLGHPSAKMNYVYFLLVSVFMLGPKSPSLSIQSERVTHVHIGTYHKNPLDTLWVKKLIYIEGTLQHYLLLLFNICVVQI